MNDDDDDDDDDDCHTVVVCLTVYEGDGRRCESSPLPVTLPSAYLANVVTQESGRGSGTCPWLVRAARGQTVNVTLLDFAADGVDPDTDGGHLSTCQIYAIIYTGAAPEPTTVCSWDRRHRVLYTHVGRQDIRIEMKSNSSSRKDFFFLLHVEGRRILFIFYRHVSPAGNRKPIPRDPLPAVSYK